MARKGRNPKIILFYGFAPVADPEALKLWQIALCEPLNLKGRILISPHGINGTLGGDIDALKKYVKTTKQYPGFKKIDFKWSEGAGNDFPRLSVKTRPELVSFVKNAVVPDVKTTKDFIAELDSGKYDHLKNKTIVTYCTGGIRCEILTTVMKERGFNEVYQIAGGIVRYGEKYGDKGLWEGSLYTFDGRKTIDFSDDAKLIGKCDFCQSPTKQFINCANDFCHNQYLICSTCELDADNLRCTHDNAKQSEVTSLHSAQPR